MLHGPEDGLVEVVALLHVGEGVGRGLGLGLAGGTPQEGDDLGAGAGVVRPEGGLRGAGGDLVHHGPVDGRVGPVVQRGHVGEGLGGAVVGRDGGHGLIQRRKGSVHFLLGGGSLQGSLSRGDGVVQLLLVIGQKVLAVDGLGGLDGSLQRGGVGLVAGGLGIDPLVVVGVVVLTVYHGAGLDAEGIGGVGREILQGDGSLVGGGKLGLGARGAVIGEDHIALGPGHGIPAQADGVVGDAGDGDVGHGVGQDAVVDGQHAVIVAAALDGDGAGADAVIVLPGEVAVVAHGAVFQIQGLAVVGELGRGLDAGARFLVVEVAAHGELYLGDILADGAADGANVVCIPGMARAEGFAAAVGLAAGVADGLDVAVFGAGAGVGGDGVVQDVVGAGVVHLIAHGEPAGLQHARDHIDLVVGVFELGAAGVFGLVQTGQAGLAHQALAAGPVDPGVLALLAGIVLGAVEGVDGLVEHGLCTGAVVVLPDVGQVIGVDVDAVVCGGDGEEDALIVLVGGGKVELGGIGHAVGLLTGGAADVIHGAVGIDLAAGHGLGTGIGVVVAGEDKADAGLVDGGRQNLMDDVAAALNVGIVRGLVHDQDLPGRGAGLGVADQPFGGLLELGAILGEVDGSHVHVAIGHGVVGGLGVHGEDGVGRGGVFICKLLVVADHVEHIRVGKGAVGALNSLQEALPGVVQGGLLYGVAELDAQREVAEAVVFGIALQILVDLGDVVGLANGGLGVAHQEEGGGGVHVVVDGLEGADLGPDLAVAHAVGVFGVDLQALDHDVVQPGGGVDEAAQDGAALGAVGEDAGAVIVGLLGVFDHSLLAGGQGVGYPGDGLGAEGVFGGVFQDVIGLAVGAARGGQDLALDGEGVAVLTLGIDGEGGVLQKLGEGLLAAGAGGAQELVGAAGKVDTHVHRGVAVQIQHADLGGLGALDGHAQLHPIEGGDGDAGGRQCKGVDHVALFFGGVFHAALGDGVDQRGALLQGGWDVEPDGGDAALAGGGRLSLADGLDGEHAVFNGIGAVGIVGGKLDGIHRGVVHLHLDLDGLDVVKPVGGQRDPVGAAQGRGVVERNQVHGGEGLVVALHGEVAADHGLVAVLVMHQDLHSVRAVGKLHGVEHKLAVGDLLGEVGVAGHIHAVEIDIAKVEAGGVFVLHVGKLGVEGDLVAVDHGAAVVGQLHGGVQRGTGLDGLDDGVVNVGVVGAVDKLQVVDVEIALLVADEQSLVADAAVDHLAGVVLLADPLAHVALAAVGVHQTDGLAAHQGDGAGHVLEVALDVLPADPVDAAQGADVPILEQGVVAGQADVLALGGEVQRLDRAGAVTHADTEPQVGGVFRRVAPEADARGAAGNLNVVVKAHAGALDAGDFAEVVVQAQSLFAEADLAGVDVDLLSRGDAAAGGAVAVDVVHDDDVAVVVGMGLIGQAAAVGVGMDVGDVVVVVAVAARFAAVKHDDGLGADAHLDGGVDRRVPLGGRADGGRDGQVAGGIVLRGHKVVALEGAGLAVALGLVDGPDKVALLDVQGGALVGGGHAQVADLAVGEVDGVVHKGDLVGRLDLDDRAAHDLVALLELHIDRAGLFAGGEQAGRRVDGAHVGAVGGKGPGKALGQRNAHAGAVNAQRREGDLGAGGVELAVGGERRMVKLAAGLGRGDHQQGRGHGALIAVGGGIFDGEHAGALALGHQRGRAAAVEVQRLDAAKIQHGLGQLAHRHTHRNRSLAAVGHKQDHGAVGLGADAGTGDAVGVIVGGDAKLAVPHQDLTAGGGLHGVGRGLHAAVADLHGAVGGHSHIAPAAGIFVPGLAVHHEQAVGLAGGHVEEAGVDHADNVGIFICLLELLFRGSRLQSGGLHTPGGAVIVLIAGLECNVGILGVDLQHEALVLLGALGAVEQKVGLLHAGRNRVFRLGDDRIIALGGIGGTRGRADGNHQQAQKQGQRQSQRRGAKRKRFGGSTCHRGILL